jgi:hypothetical protein
VPTILLMALIGALGAVAAGLSVLGLRQHLRTAARARAAHEAGLRFSAQDAFDVPRRCAAFALCSAGHSAQASNVTHGRVGGLPVRAFDFRCEAGHGTRRTTRRYFVVFVEEPAEPDVLMWNRRDAANAPCAARLGDGAVGEWSCRGDAEQARRLGELAEPLAAAGVSVEARAEGLMLCFPPRRRTAAGAGWLEGISRMIASLWPGGAAAGGPASADEKGRPQAVANRPQA